MSTGRFRIGYPWVSGSAVLVLVAVFRPRFSGSHYYTKYFAQRFQIGLGGGQIFRPPRLIHRLTEAVLFY